uniref:Origin recognition complex subunit 5 C-terminal domain-containing protein n=1 Tax=Rhodnius prolixus TaxID=13249 RepID=T1HUX1_RHOPR
MALECQATYKVLVLGDSNVGKTCIVHRYCDETYYDTYISTIGIDFKQKIICVDGTPIKMQIWDTAGQERFRTLTTAYYRGAMGILLMYDVTSMESFNNLTYWLKNIEEILSNFPTYCEPVKKGDISSNDVVGLWRHIVPHLKESLNNVYLGVICRKNDETINNTTDLTAHSSKTLCAFDLPYYAKYFLIASYLASYNSPKYDRRLFLKNHGKHKKKNLRIKIKENITNELLGPKPFSLDRLLAIFYAIMEEKASLTVNLMSQIASLVELRLLAKLGDSCIEKPKYKCLVGFECVDVVAKTLGFNLKKYLLE